MNTKIEQLHNFLQSTPKDSFLKHALGLEYIKINDLNNAQKYFEEIIKENPNYIGTYYHLSKLYETLNLKEKAKITYEMGMLQAKQENELHAYNELKIAYEDFLDT